MLGGLCHRTAGRVRTDTALPVPALGLVFAGPMGRGGLTPPRRTTPARSTGLWRRGFPQRASPHGRGRGPPRGSLTRRCCEGGEASWQAPSDHARRRARHVTPPPGRAAEPRCCQGAAGFCRQLGPPFKQGMQWEDEGVDRDAPQSLSLGPVTSPLCTPLGLPALCLCNRRTQIVISNSRTWSGTRAF